MKKYNLAFLGSGAMGTEVIDYVISNLKDKFNIALIMDNDCLLYTSDAADE